MISCPLCNKDDQIQKASSVYSAGTGTGGFSGPTTTLNNNDGKLGVGVGYISGTSNTISGVAQKCAPPRTPSKPPIPLKVFIGIGVMIFSALSTNCAVTSSDYLGVAVCGILGLIIVTKGLNEKSEKEKQYPELLKKYNEELTEWKLLYYCHRDDILFNPNTSTYWTFN